MKNSHLPLIQALKGRSKPKSEPALPSFEAPRAFELNHHEIPGLPNRKVGEQISVKLQGHIHSQNADGRTVMHVSDVKPDSNGETNEANPDVSVRTQESHV